MFPNSDPVMFMVAFYGCLLAELVPVPIEVPLTRKVTSLASAMGSGSMRFYYGADTAVLRCLLHSREWSVGVILFTDTLFLM